MAYKNYKRKKSQAPINKPKAERANRTPIGTTEGAIKRLCSLHRQKKNKPGTTTDNGGGRSRRRHGPAEKPLPAAEWEEPKLEFQCLCVYCESPELTQAGWRVRSRSRVRGDGGG